ncbi:MAG: hypothetical protein LLH30_11455 [Candidatus Manganitrophus sp. SA1]|jgi:hypothetical protein|nr:hypothetical protein [Candidatus Manganitrophus morganii]MCG3116286.1 hypothetical protein [Candidatus Manganitrophus morganii]
MADKKENGKRKLKIVKPEYTLTYGIRLDPGTAPEQVHPHVPVTLPDGTEGEMPLHVMNGSLAEIRRQLHESIDAYFEIYQERGE